MSWFSGTAREKVIVFEESAQQGGPKFAAYFFDPSCTSKLREYFQLKYIVRPYLETEICQLNFRKFRRVSLDPLCCRNSVCQNSDPELMSLD